MIIRSAFLKVCADTRFQRQLWNKKWLQAEIWIEALAKSNNIDQTLMSSIKVGTLNVAFGQSKGNDAWPNDVAIRRKHRANIMRQCQEISMMQLLLLLLYPAH